MKYYHRLWIKFFFVFLLFLIWEIIAYFEIWPSYIFPSPINVFTSLIQGFAQDHFLTGIFVSMKRLWLGFFLSIFIGVPLGLMLGRLKIIQDTIGTVIFGLQSLPSICWLPLAVLWFGLSEAAVIFIVFMGAVVSIIVSTADGVKNINPIYIQSGIILGAKNMKFYTKIILPSAFPAIISGLKLGWTFAWRSLMAGELLYSSSGIGQLLNTGREFNDMARVIAVMIIIILIGLLIDKVLFQNIENKVRKRWGLIH